MKFTYVLVSTNHDYYPEETFISMFTLRKHHPNSHILLITDKPTFDTLEGNRARLKNYTDDIIILNPPAHFNPCQRSRFLKTSLRQNIDGDFLYLDNDTIITGDLSELSQIDGEVAAVLNQHREDWSMTNLHLMLELYYSHAGKQINEDKYIKDYFNGGVFFCRDSVNSHKFFQKWHELWLKDVTEINFYKDQPSMWRANYLCGNLLKRLDGIYNCQLIYPRFSLPFLGSAKILHYFSSTSKANHLKIKDNGFLDKIRHEGISITTENYIRNFKIEYLNGLRIIMDEEKDFYDSPFGIMSKKIFRTLPVVNSISRKIYSLFGYKI